jgi:hypothetical protein
VLKALLPFVLACGAFTRMQAATAAEMSAGNANTADHPVQTQTVAGGVGALEQAANAAAAASDSASEGGRSAGGADLSTAMIRAILMGRPASGPTPAGGQGNSPTTDSGAKNRDFTADPHSDVPFAPGQTAIGQAGSDKAGARQADADQADEPPRDGDGRFSGPAQPSVLFSGDHAYVGRVLPSEGSARCCANAIGDSLLGNDDPARRPGINLAGPFDDALDRPSYTMDFAPLSSARADGVENQVQADASPEGQPADAPPGSAAPGAADPPRAPYVNTVTMTRDQVMSLTEILLQPAVVSSALIVLSIVVALISIRALWLSSLLVVAAFAWFICGYL